MNKLQGERAVVNKKYGISLSPVIKSRETPEGGGRCLLIPIPLFPKKPPESFAFFPPVTFDTVEHSGAYKIILDLFRRFEQICFLKFRG